MDKQVIGSCSICGGNVVAYTGAWMSILPPPLPTCTHCGAVNARSELPVIPMVPRPNRFRPWKSNGEFNEDSMLSRFYKRFGTYSGSTEEECDAIEDCYG